MIKVYLAFCGCTTLVILGMTWGMVTIAQLHATDRAPVRIDCAGSIMHDSQITTGQQSAGPAVSFHSDTPQAEIK